MSPGQMRDTNGLVGRLRLCRNAHLHQDPAWTQEARRTMARCRQGESVTLICEVCHCDIATVARAAAIADPAKVPAAQRWHDVIRDARRGSMLRAHLAPDGRRCIGESWYGHMPSPSGEPTVAFCADCGVGSTSWSRVLGADRSGRPGRWG